MRVRYQADADLNRAIVLAVIRQEPAIDFQTANDAGLEGVGDPEVLALAAAEGRILVTHDRRTMPTHFASFIVGHESPGVMIISQKVRISVAVEELVLIWALTEPSEWVNRICTLPL